MLTATLSSSIASPDIPLTQHQGCFVADRGIEVSVVIPCLNEADTLGACLRKARQTLGQSGVVGEIIVADNGSTDGSRELAARLGARVVAVGDKGYGSALMGGIAAARGRYVIMGDADDSYDFSEIPQFLAVLRQGHDLVMGCRLPRGGGRVLRGAMPALHRWIGNPLFSWLAQRLFAVPVHDVYCGLRGFTKRSYDSLDLQCRGMEFAIEMIVKASLLSKRISEIPITLHPDGRKARGSHLRTFRDGWRTLCFLARTCRLRHGLTTAAKRSRDATARNGLAGDAARIGLG